MTTSSYIVTMSADKVLEILPDLLRDSDRAPNATASLMERFRLDMDSRDETASLLRCLATHSLAAQLHPSILQQLLEVMSSISHPEIIIHSIPLLVGSSASRESVLQIADAFKDILSVDRALLVPIMGSLLELPLPSSLAAELSDLSLAALEVVDDEDIPAVVRVLVGNLTRGKDPTTAMAVLQTQYKTFPDHIVPLVLEIIAHQLRVNKSTAKICLTVIGSATTITEFDLFVLLMLLNDDGRRNLRSTCLKAREVISRLAMSGALRASLLSNVIKRSTSPGIAYLRDSLVLLCRLLINETAESCSMKTQVKQRGMHQLFQRRDSGGKVVDKCLLSEAAGKGLITLFTLHRETRPAVMLTLMSMTLENDLMPDRLPSSRASFTAAQVAAELFAVICVSWPQAASQFSHHLEEALTDRYYNFDRVDHDAGKSNFDPYVLHRLCESIGAIAKVKTGMSNSLMIPIQKQLLSGRLSEDVPVIASTLVAHHLLRCGCLSPSEQNTVMTWTKRVLPYMCASPLVLPYALDLLANAPLTMNETSMLECNLCLGMLPLIRQVGLMPTQIVDGTLQRVSDWCGSKYGLVFESSVEVGGPLVMIASGPTMNSHDTRSIHTAPNPLYPISGAMIDFTSFATKYCKVSSWSDVTYGTGVAAATMASFGSLIQRIAKINSASVDSNTNLLDLAVAWASVPILLPSTNHHTTGVPLNWWCDDVQKIGEAAFEISESERIKLAWCCTAAIEHFALVANNINEISMEFFSSSSTTTNLGMQRRVDDVLVTIAECIIKLQEHARWLQRVDVVDRANPFSNSVVLHPHILCLTACRVLSAATSAELMLGLPTLLLDMLLMELDSQQPHFEANISPSWSVGSLHTASFVRLRDACDIASPATVSSSSEISVTKKKDEWSGCTSSRRLMIQELINFSIPKLVSECLLDSVTEMGEIRRSVSLEKTSDADNMEAYGLIASISSRLLIAMFVTSGEIDVRTSGAMSGDDSESSLRLLLGETKCKLIKCLSSSGRLHRGGVNIQSNLMAVFADFEAIWSKVEDWSLSCIILELLTCITQGLKKAEDVALKCISSLRNIYPLHLTSCVCGFELLVDRLRGNKIISFGKSGSKLQSRHPMTYIRFMFHRGISLMHSEMALETLSTSVLAIEQFLSLVPYSASSGIELGDKSALELVMQWSGHDKKDFTHGSEREEHIIWRSLNIDTCRGYIQLIFDATLDHLERGHPQLTTVDPYVAVAYPLAILKRLFDIFGASVSKSTIHNSIITSKPLLIFMLQRCVVTCRKSQKQIELALDWRCNEGAKYDKSSALTASESSGDHSKDPFHTYHVSRLMWEATQLLESMSFLNDRVRANVIDGGTKDSSKPARKVRSIAKAVNPLASALKRSALSTEVFSDWIRDVRVRDRLLWTEGQLKKWQTTIRASKTRSLFLSTDLGDRPLSEGDKGGARAADEAFVIDTSLSKEYGDSGSSDKEPSEDGESEEEEEEAEEEQGYYARYAKGVRTSSSTESENDDEDEEGSDDEVLSYADHEEREILGEILPAISTKRVLAIATENDHTRTTTVAQPHKKRAKLVNVV